MKTKLDQANSQLERALNKNYDFVVKKIENNSVAKLISAYVEDVYGFNVDDIRLRTRKREIVDARQLSMYFMKKYTDFPLSLIGLYYGGFDHSTVIYSINNIENLAEFDKNISKVLSDFKKYIDGQNKETKKQIFVELLYDAEKSEESMIKWMNRYENAL